MRAISPRGRSRSIARVAVHKALSSVSQNCSPSTDGRKRPAKDMASHVFNYDPATLTGTSNKCYFLRIKKKSSLLSNERMGAFIISCMYLYFFTSANVQYGVSAENFQHLSYRKILAHSTSRGMAMMVLCRKITNSWPMFKGTSLLITMAPTSVR